jgi:hypothetical protein
MVQAMQPADIQHEHDGIQQLQACHPGCTQHPISLFSLQRAGCGYSLERHYSQ